MGLKLKVILVAIIISSLLTAAEAAWQGPTEVLSGAWGNKLGQFGFESGDTGDSFPKNFCVSSGGFVAIADELNSRVMIYNNGSFVFAFGPRNIPESAGWKGGWPARLGCMSNAVYTEFDKYTQLYNINGSVIKSWDNLQGGLLSILNNDNFITYTSTNYFLYSPTGQLFKTYTTKPPELGKIEKLYISSGQYKIIVTYPDSVWSIIGRGVVPKYTRDVNGNLYGSGNKQAIRWNFCGRELARLTMPEPEVTDDGFTTYGTPVLAPNGDVYTWKRTPDKYSIVKWTWKDDPGSNDDCPAEKAKDNKAAGKK
jgi:hypothetical protein